MELDTQLFFDLGYDKQRSAREVSLGCVEATWSALPLEDAHRDHPVPNHLRRSASGLLPERGREVRLRDADQVARVASMVRVRSLRRARREELRLRRVER